MWLSYYQCTVDCEPCVGPTDPFCASGGSGGSQQRDAFCNNCAPDRNDPVSGQPKQKCQGILPGETGLQVCTIVKNGNKFVSCTASGLQCYYGTQP